MTQIPPTTTYEVEKPDRSPCCDAALELVSPPIGYECRDCMAEYTLGDADEEPETCDAVKADGDVCGRELPCPYHS